MQEESGVPLLFEDWLEKHYPEVSALSAKEDLSEEEKATIHQCNQKYLDAKLAAAITPVQQFSHWLQEHDYPAASDLFPGTLAALNKIYLAERFQGEDFSAPLYDKTYARISANGVIHHFPPRYFSTFEDKKVFVVDTHELKKSHNPEVVRWNNDKGKFVFEERDSEHPTQDFVRDIYRSLNIAVETEENGVRILKRVHVVASEQELVSNSEGNDTAVSQSDSSQSDESFDTRSQVEKDKAILKEVYHSAKLAAYGVKWETYKNAAQAYYQALLYKLSCVITALLPEDFGLNGQSSIVSDLVFYLNGDVSLALYGQKYELQCSAISTHAGYLKAEFSAPVFFCFPLNKIENVFETPLICCNTKFVPILFPEESQLAIVPPAVVRKKNKGVIDPAQEVEKQKELEGQVERDLAAKSKKGGKLKRDLMKGKHKGKIIKGTAVGSFGVAAIVTLALIPGGQLPAFLTALGLTVDALITAGIALGFAGTVSLVGTSVMAAFYFLIRKVNRRPLPFVELENFSFSGENIEDGFVMMERESTQVVQVSPPPSAFFRGDSSSSEKGKEEEVSEEDVPAQTQSNSDSPRKK